MKPIVSFLVCLLAILSFFYLSNINLRGLNTGDADNVVERQLYGLSILSHGDAITAEQSTIFLSWYVLNNYFICNPLFGNWQLYSKESYGLVSPDNRTVTDATLAVYLSDIGIIGILLFIYIQLKILLLTIGKSRRKWGVLLYMYALLSTYTDIGIFGGMFLSNILIICFLLSKNINCMAYSESHNKQLPYYNL